MFNFFSSKCTMCKRKAAPYRIFRNPEGKKVKLCMACSEYAERRAYLRIG